MEKVFHIPNILKKIRKNNFLDQKDIGTILEIHRTQVSNYENGKSSIPESQLIKFANHFNVKIDDLVDEENQLKNLLEEPTIEYLSSKRIPYYNIYVTASNLDVFEENKEFISGYFELPYKNDYDMACDVKGDSMSPKYNNGDIIFGNKITDMSLIDYGGDFLIITKEQRLFKVIRQSKNSEALTLESRNKNYDSFDILKEKIVALFRIKGRHETTSS